MKVQSIFVAVVAVLAAAVVIVLRLRTEPAAPESPAVQRAPSAQPSEFLSEPAPAAIVLAPRSNTVVPGETIVISGATPTNAASLNKAERLAQARETFRALAGGDPQAALRSARQITDETEREAALLALITEWTRGELSPPRQRAQAIARFGLEAGLGLEIAKNPDLAVLWAAELTEGEGRAAVLEQAAITMLDTDPTAAFALSEQFAADQRRQFVGSVFAGWAEKDTDAALQWAEKLPDPSERDAAIQAIRAVAPVGIGAAMEVKDGYPVIRQLLPGTPAELSGQIQPGDRILALAQGDNTFVDAHGLALKDIVQMIRGAPGSLVQLQVLPADAAPNTTPRTVSIVRGQIKFKR